MKKSLIKVSMETEEIIVARNFHKKACVFGTKEYKELKRARNSEPTFTVRVREIARNKNKKTYANLTFRNMARYIAIKEGSDSPNITSLNKIMNAADIQSSRYAFVKSWFLEHYPNYTDPDALLEETAKSHPITEDEIQLTAKHEKALNKNGNSNADEAA